MPRAAIEALSLAYGAYVVITTDFRNGIQTEFTQNDLSALFAVTMARGQAMGIFGMAGGNMLAVRDGVLRKKLLADAGFKGAQVRLKPYASLKAWALAAAADMRDQDIDIARKLSARIPSHLANTSKDPKRLIYDALRARNKPD